MIRLIHDLKIKPTERQKIIKNIFKDLGKEIEKI